MNITPYAPTLSTPTVVNPPTEGLRRENNQREIITQVAGANPSAAEKGVASEKDRARSSAQNNEQIDFANLRKQAEIAAGTINEKNGSSGEHPQDSKDQHTEHQSTDSSQHDDNHDIEDAESQANEKIIRQLESRDKEVRIHERAHASVGGSATGSPSYSFDIGPDGKQYAVSGEVSVDLSTVPGDPQATIQKMQQVHAAALAPVSPSAQDIRVAANATQIILQAQSELLAQGTDKTTSNSSNIANSNSALKDDNDQRTSSDDFDTLINQTLHAQEAIAPNQTNLNDSPSSAKQTFEVQQRAQRVETFYHSVSQGYERPDKYQFEITA